jgi:hypothetical protein
MRRRRSPAGFHRRGSTLVGGSMGQRLPALPRGYEARQRAPSERLRARLEIGSAHDERNCDDGNPDAQRRGARAQ